MSAVRVSRSRGPRCGVSRRRGLATVELAVLLPPLLALLFGTLEIGYMARQSQALSHVAREAARVAATGATMSRIQANTIGVAPSLDPRNIQTSIQYRHWDDAGGAWGSWATLADDGVENAAATGDQIRVGLQYSYELATGGLFAGLLNASEGNVVTVSSTIVVVRE